MRTTLTIDDDVLAAARALAEARDVSLGDAISELARRGLATPTTSTHGLPTFAVQPDARPLTPEMVEEALDTW